MLSLLQLPTPGDNVGGNYADLGMEHRVGGRAGEAVEHRTRVIHRSPTGRHAVPPARDEAVHVVHSSYYYCCSLCWENSSKTRGVHSWQGAEPAGFAGRAQPLR